MPKIFIPNRGVSESVTRPIVFDVARKIMEWTGIGDVRILFPGKSEEAYQPGSNIDELDRAKINLSSENLIRIRVRETFEKDRLLTSAVLQLDNKCIFKDTDVGVYLVPAYTKTDLDLEIEFRSTDKNSADRWRNEYHQRISTNRAGLVHTVSYNYLIPEEYKNLLRHVHALRENQAGYGESFDEYTDKYFLKTVAESTTLAGTEPRWTVSENQTRVLGHFEFDGGPDEAQKQGEGSAVSSSFTYKVQYATPLGVAADYPILIHNQLIDSQWLAPAMENENDPAIDYPLSSSGSTSAIMQFERWNQVASSKESGLRFPPFHEFFPKSVFASTLSIASVLIGCNPPDAEGDNRNLMNLTELDDEYKLSDQFIKMCKREHRGLNKYGHSFVNVSVYNSGYPMHESRFHVDKDLNVWLTEEPDLRKTYYVRLSLVTDPFILSNKVREYMRDYGQDLNMIAGVLCPNLIEYDMLAKLVNGNYVTRVEADKLYDRIRKCTKTSFGGLMSDHAPVTWKLVNTLFVVAHKSSEL